MPKVFKALSILVLVLMIVLFPPTTLAIISQNAIPGESLYPVKRKLEEGILLIASFNPTTSALYASSLSGTRFKEATGLIAQKNEVEASKSLKELVSQTSIAVSQIDDVSDPNRKKEIATNLVNSINDYNKSLEQAKVSLAEDSQPEPTIEPTETPILPSPTPTSSLKVKPSPTSKVIPTPSPIIRRSPSPQPNIPPPTPSSGLTSDIDLTTVALTKQRERIDQLLNDSNNDTSDTVDVADTVDLDPGNETIITRGWENAFAKVFNNPNNGNRRGLNNEEN